MKMSKKEKFLKEIADNLFSINLTLREQVKIDKMMMEDSRRNQEIIEIQNTQLIEACKRMMKAVEDQQVQLEAYKEAAERWSKETKKLDQKIKRLEDKEKNTIV